MIDAFFIATAVWLLLGLVVALLLGRVISDADQRETQPETEPLPAQREWWA